MEVKSPSYISFSLHIQNFRKTSQYGSLHLFLSDFVFPFPHFRKTSQYGSCSVCANTLLVISRFQKNQLVWKFYPLSIFTLSWIRLFQKNQLVWNNIENKTMMLMLCRLEYCHNAKNQTSSISLENCWKSGMLILKNMEL